MFIILEYTDESWGNKSEKTDNSGGNSDLLRTILNKHPKYIWTNLAESNHLHSCL